MNATKTTDRTYRFAPVAQTGVLLGLSALQCVVLGAGIILAGIVLNHGIHPVVALVPMTAAVAGAFAPVAGRPLHEWAPIGLRWVTARLTGRTLWFRPLPTLATRGTNRSQQAPEMPPVLRGIHIDGDATSRSTVDRGCGAAIVHDRRERTMSATVRVRGGRFSLCERTEQDRLVQLWGDVLGGFCRERGAVSRVRWTEWMAPGGHDTHLAYFAEHRRRHDTSAVEIYRDLLEATGPRAARHETLVTVTIDERRVRSGRRHDTPAAAEALLEEVRLLTTRLEAAGLGVDPPLTPQETASAFRARLDPYSTPGVAGRRTLANLAGIGTGNAAPMAWHAAWDHVRIDRAVHAAYVVAEWPRLDVPANWMEPLLLHNGGIRTVAMVFEPVAPSRSRRQIDRDSTRLATDEEQRDRAGFRVGARHHRARADVHAREAELVAGYAELEYTGLVVVTAPDLDTLLHSCAEYEQVAAQCGMELRRLDGRHDLAVRCALPIGRGIEARRLAW